MVDDFVQTVLQLLFCQKKYQKRKPRINKLVYSIDGIYPVQFYIHGINGNVAIVV